MYQLTLMGYQYAFCYFLFEIRIKSVFSCQME